MAENNYTIMRDIWLKGNNDFQLRIPEPTQSNITKTVAALFDPMNQNYFNQFMDALPAAAADHKDTSEAGSCKVI